MSLKDMTTSQRLYQQPKAGTKVSLFYLFRKISNFCIEKLLLIWRARLPSPISSMANYTFIEDNLEMLITTQHCWLHVSFQLHFIQHVS